MIEPRCCGSTRRSATVTSSLPLTRIASPISSSERKPPVPSTRRLRNALPAIMSGSSIAAGLVGVVGLVLMRASSSLDRGEDLDACAAGERRLAPCAAPHDLAVDRDRDAARVERDAEQ